MDKELDYSEFLKMLSDTDSAENAANPVNSEKAEFVRELRDWFYRCIEIDAKTGEPLNDDLTHFLDKLADSENAKKAGETEKNVCDWLFKILSYAEKSVFYIFDSPKKEILRFHEQLPVYKAKEIDSTGIIDISRRPGRSVREKLAYKPSVIAVKRKQSIDTLENRLFKKFVKKSIVILEERLDYYGEEKLKFENEESKLSVLYSKLCRWLKSDEAEEIGEWQNLPPNNILLCDKYYKKIWAAWRGLTTLEDLIQDDFKNLDQLIAVSIFWKTAALLQKKNCKLKQQPLSFNYEEFQVRTPCYLSDDNSDEKYAVISTDDFIFSIKDNVIIWQQKNKAQHIIKVGFDLFEIDGKPYKESLKSLESVNSISEKLTCSIYKEWNRQYRTLPSSYKETQAYTVLDFSESPYLSISNTSFDAASKETVEYYPKQLLRQFWKKKAASECINLDCGIAPALYKDRLNDFEIKEINAADILYESVEPLDDSLTEHKIEAEYNFMTSIKDYYNTNSLYFILPDYLEDFSLGLIRSTANIVFMDSNPVPASVGAVFDFQNSTVFTSYSLNDNDFVFVIEKKSFSENKTILSITPLCAKTKYKKDDNTKLVNLDSIKEIPGGIRWEHHPSLIVNDYEPSKVMEYIKDAVSKTEGMLPSSSIYIISNQESIKNARLALPAANWHFIATPFNSAKGVAFSVKLQHLVRDIPMWSEHLPNLQMTVIVDGKRKFINLTNGKTVLPIRNQAQDLDISEVFTLNKNVKEFHFRLIRGIGDNIPALKYEACLTNPAFPLRNNTKCQLKMSYSYGQAHPFDLKFVPITSSNFVQATVEWKKIDETKFPVPNFPEKRKWTEFVNWKNIKTNKPEDLTEKNAGNFRYLIALNDYCLGKIKENCTVINRYTALLPSDLDRYRMNDYIPIKINDNTIVRIACKRLKDLITQSDTNYNEFSFSVDKKTGRTFGISLGSNLHPLMFKSISRLRFPAMQIWNNRKTINTEDVPTEFKQNVNNVIMSVNKLLNNKQIQTIPYLWNELLLLACIMHEEGICVSEDLIESKLDVVIDFSQNWKVIEQSCFQFAYFIDDASSEVQKKVFEWALEFSRNGEDSSLDSFKLQILTIALWRNETLLTKISVQKMKELLIILSRLIDLENRNLIEYRNEGSLSNRKLNTLRSYFELLCAMLRSRKLSYDYQQLLSPFSENIQKLISTIEEIYLWLKVWLTENNRVFYAKQIKLIVSDTSNSFLDYILIWLDGQNSTEMPKIESATSENPDDEEDSTETYDEE